MKCATLFIIFLLSIFIVNADTDYLASGGNDSSYDEGTGFFNAQTVGASFASRSISTPRHIPLVGDLDGDGINEIVVNDGNAYELYNTKDLTILDSIIVAGITGTPYFILFDIDGDGRKEIIGFSDFSGSVDVIDWNGTALGIQQTFVVASYGTGVTGGEGMVACRGTDDCMVFHAFDNTEGGSSNVQATPFNSSTRGTALVLDGSFSGYCLSKIRHITVADYDNDGTDEYIMNAIALRGTGVAEVLQIFYVDADKNTLIATEEQQISQTLFDFSPSLDSCTSDQGKFFTSPLVSNLDGAAGNGLETMIGFNIDADEFNMRAYDSAGGTIDTFPAIADADGTIISNVLKADNEGFSSCVVGYSSVLGRMNVLCASLTDSIGLFDNLQYKFDDIHYNITEQYEFQNVISHSGDMSSVDAPNTDELINSYGVFNLDFGSCSAITGNCDIDLIFNISNVLGQENIAVVPADVEKVGRDDLLGLSLTNLFYFDDGFSNSPANITQIFINPCLDSTWKINTTVNVQVQVTDFDGDNVNANATTYFGLENEMAESSGNASSGTTFSFAFVANETVGSATLRVVGKDVENPLSPDIIDLSYSVSGQGVEFGECTTLLNFAAVNVTVDPFITGTDIPSNNSATSAVTTISEVTNLSPSLVWLFFMFIVAIVMFGQGVQKSGADILSLFGIIALVQVILLIIGTVLTFLSIGIVISITVIVIAGLALVFRRMAASPA
ncbi:hypothetical protein LCGC14_0577060 [marine sediment metagenome]|uniref:Uncharacterized protein n=1 Tax=marine sediment metagenome TaxID=412755 RepID=A0A0F9RMJ2_9ZZZZ